MKSLHLENDLNLCVCVCVRLPRFFSSHQFVQVDLIMPQLPVVIYDLRLTLQRLYHVKCIYLFKIQNKIINYL